MSREIRGIGVASGVAIGRAHLLAPSELEVRQFNIERHDVLHEVARLNNAFSLVRAELDSMRDAVAPSAPPEVRAFLDLHRIILDDSLLSDVPRDLVRQRLINAEWRSPSNSRRCAVSSNRSATNIPRAFAGRATGGRTDSQGAGGRPRADCDPAAQGRWAER